jgi:hypothetical protein
MMRDFDLAGGKIPAKLILHRLNRRRFGKSCIESGLMFQYMPVNCGNHIPLFRPGCKYSPDPQCAQYLGGRTL